MDKFENNSKVILDYLTEKTLNKSCEYLEGLLKNKKQGARSHHPLIFDAGIITTSRAESCNAIIKKYLDSRSEISDLIEFIVEFKERYMESKEVNFKSLSLIENTLLAKNLKLFCQLILIISKLRSLGKH